MTPFSLEVLGTPRLKSGEGELLKVGRLPLAVLTYLALESRPVSREHLGSLFWPRSDRTRQLHNVRQAALRIRHGEPEGLLEGNGTLSLRLGVLSTDVQDFLDQIVGGKVESAIQLWRGPFLEGVRRPESWELEEWIDQKRSMLEDVLATAVVREVRLDLESGSAADALRLVQVPRGILPYHEEIGVLNVLALAAVGRGAEAEGMLRGLDLEGRDDLGAEARDALVDSATELIPEPVPPDSSMPESAVSRAGPRFPSRRLVFGFTALLAVMAILWRGSRFGEPFGGTEQPGYALITCTTWATDGQKTQAFRMGFDGKDKHRLTTDAFCRMVWVEAVESFFGVMPDSAGIPRIFQASPNPDNPITEWTVIPVQSSTHLRDPEVERATPSVGNGNSFVFSALDDGGNRDAYVLATESGELRRLTSSPAVDRAPSIDAGSSAVIFSSDRSGGGDLFSIQLDGTQLTRLTHDPLQDWYPRVRGDTVLFVRGRGVEEEDGDMELVLLDLTSGEEVRLTDNGWNDYEQAWSPDGRYICWQTEEFGHFESDIMAQDLLTGRRWRVSDTPGRENDCLWTPDGKGIVVMSWGTRGDPDLFLLDPFGDTAINLTRLPGQETVVGFFRLPEALR